MDILLSVLAIVALYWIVVGLIWLVESGVIVSLLGIAVVIAFLRLAVRIARRI